MLAQALAELAEAAPAPGAWLSKGEASGVHKKGQESMLMQR